MNTVPYTLTNWALTPTPGVIASPYTPPELWPRSLHGNVSGHPSFEEGASIVTSSIVRTYAEYHSAVRLFAETKSSLYELVGPPDPGYEAAYPGARERLLRSTT